MLRSIGKQSGESVESVTKKKGKATLKRICRKGSNDGIKLYTLVKCFVQLSSTPLLVMINVCYLIV